MRLSLFGTLIFFIGLLTLTTAVHELSHIADHKINSYDYKYEQFCSFGISYTEDFLAVGGWLMHNSRYEIGDDRPLFIRELFPTAMTLIFLFTVLTYYYKNADE